MDLRNEITLRADPVWTDQYEKEREQILEALEDQPLGIFHVGSTAIPDVPGKPALDILMVFADSGSMHATAEILIKREYDLEHDDHDCMVVIDWREDSAVFVKMHLRDDERVRNQLIFREYLRANREARREYEQVKRKAVADHPDDQEAYTRAKAEVVRSLLERARDQGYAEELPEYA